MSCYQRWICHYNDGLIKMRAQEWKTEYRMSYVHNLYDGFELNEYFTHDFWFAGGTRVTWSQGRSGMLLLFLLLNESVRHARFPPRHTCDLVLQGSPLQIQGPRGTKGSKGDLVRSLKFHYVFHLLSSSVEWEENSLLPRNLSLQLACVWIHDF